MGNIVLGVFVGIALMLGVAAMAGETNPACPTHSAMSTLWQETNAILRNFLKT